MNIVNKYSIASILILIYLLLPVSNFVHAATFEAGGCSVQPSDMADTSPGNDSPCSDDQKTDCCDTTICNCACHAPLIKRFQLSYSPVVLIHRVSEPSWALPQVDLPIFVPPQNPA